MTGPLLSDRRRLAACNRPLCWPSRQVSDL